MRKLLLTSSALVAAASISSYAVADVSVTGGFEWAFKQQGSDITALDGDSFVTDNEVIVMFTNKTDSGLTIQGKWDVDADNAGAHGGSTDESALYISGGFGKLALGLDDEVNDAFGMAEIDLIDEDYNGADASATILTSAGESGASDNNSISYFTPAIAGFKAGISSRDSGANGKTDMVAYGGSYTVPVGGGSLEARYNEGSTDVDGAVSTDTKNFGVKFNMGAMTVIASTAQSKGNDEDIKADGFGIKYDMGGGMTVAATKMEAEDSLDMSGTVKEKYEANVAELVYTVAPGLKAKLTYVDYDYNAGGESAADSDAGEITVLTLSASF
jgi:hypothetical protein